MPLQRVHERERLNRLLRIEVVAFGLVGEVEPGPDDGQAANGAAAGMLARRQRGERLIERKVGGNRRVRRQAAIAVHRGIRRQPRRVVGEQVGGREQLLVLPLLGDHARARFDQELTRAVLPGGRRQIDAAPFDDLAGKPHAFVGARVRHGGDEIVEAADEERFGLRWARERRDIAGGGARLRRECRAVQPEIDDRVFVAAIEPAANHLVVTGGPGWPRRVELCRRYRANVGRNLVAEVLQDRSRFRRWKCEPA